MKKLPDTYKRVLSIDIKCAGASHYGQELQEGAEDIRNVRQWCPCKTRRLLQELTGETEGSLR